MGFKYFSNNGLIVHHPNPETGEYPEGGSYLGDRRPVLYRPESRDVFVGEPGWYHADTYRHYGMDQYQYPGPRTYEGFFNGDEEWGNGTLRWYSPPSPDEHNAVKLALQNAGHEVLDEDPEPEDVDEDDWT